MSSSQSKASFWCRGPFLFGILLTILVSAFGAFSLFAWPNCSGPEQCQSNFDILRFQSKPNEIGDMLAGFAGALAFIWIVVTVLLQAIELREQRQQFEKMADAQEAQVKLLVKQGEIFEQEQKERQEERVGKLVDEFLVGFCDLIRMQADGNSSWSVIDRNGKSRTHNFMQGYSMQSNEELLKKLAYFPPPIVEGITKLQKAGVAIQKGPSFEDFYDLCDRIFQVICRLDELSPDQRQRMETLGLTEIHSWLEGILKSEFWAGLPNNGRVE